MTDSPPFVLIVTRGKQRRVWGVDWAFLQITAGPHSSVSVKLNVSTKDYEIVTVSFRPFYPPLEFGRVTVILVYVPSPDKARAAGRIAQSYNKAVVSRAVDRPVSILRDFNSCDINDPFPTWNSLSRSLRGTSVLWTNATGTFPTHLPHAADSSLEKRTTMLCTLCLLTDRN